MLFKVILRQDFTKLIELIMESNEVIGPKQVGEKADGKPVVHFLPITKAEELDLEYERTDYSAKTYFLPYEENLSEFDFSEGDWEQNIKYRIKPRALVGLRPCDINGLLKLDKVFIKDSFPSPYYRARRKNTIVIGVDHEPCKTGFCASIDADTVEHGFDLFLTPINGSYMVSIGSDRGYNLLAHIPSREVTDQDTSEYMAVRRRYRENAETKVDVSNLANLLDLEFESEVWDKWGEKCLSCGACAMVCPTCYCYGVHERVSMDYTHGKKVKTLHACTLVDFAVVAGNHNFRPGRAQRLKYRYYHQHRGFLEAYDEALCVGCNRCGEVCLADISPPAVISDLQEECLR